MVISIFLVLALFPYMVYIGPKAHVIKCRLYDLHPPLSVYHHPGHLIIGGIISHGGFISDQIAFTEEPPVPSSEKLKLVPITYQHILALVFAVKEINENPQILPNLTLGFHIYDSHFNALLTYHATMQLLSTQESLVPNYVCDTHNNLVSVIGGLDADTSLHMATILDTYKVPQITYGHAPVMNDKTPGLPFYQMAPQETSQCEGILYLLLHFRWTWIGLIAADNDSGEKIVQTVLPMFSERDVCFAFIERIRLTGIKDMLKRGAELYDKIMSSTANVVVAYRDSDFMIVFIMYISEVQATAKGLKGKVWVLTAHIERFAKQKAWDTTFLHGSLVFRIHSHDLPEFTSFVQNRSSSNTEGDGFIQNFWQRAFHCVFPNPVVEMVNRDICTGEEKVENLPRSFFEMSMTGHSYNIYNAVYAVAHAVHAMSSSGIKCRTAKDPKGQMLLNQNAWQLYRFLDRVSFNNNAHNEVHFNQNGESAAGFDLFNWNIFPNKSFHEVKVGSMNPWAPTDAAFIVDEDVITWHSWFNQSQPSSACSESCHPGSRKKVKEGVPFCCYDCVQCPEGKISDQKDMNDCRECTDKDYPSKNQDFCVQKTIAFLSYTEPVGIGLTCLALSFSLITVLVLVTFVKHHNTPLVKANNRNISYILLISLLLSFLSTMLYLAQPGKVMCFLQRTVISIIFSVAISCVLAKTITVVLAFMANRPGSRMRNWTGTKLFYSIVFSCSLIPAGIFNVWMGYSPPYPDMDTHIIAEQIVLKCNVLRADMALCLMSYVTILTTVNLLVAFLARKLPASFNEAKFIVISMMVFAGVWLSFFSTQLSTNGMATVAVEIFSILASSAGLLSCIFFPKCFILLWKPELNSKAQLIRRKE